MFDTLTFDTNNTSFSINADGKAEKAANGVTTDGTWSTSIDTPNRLTLKFDDGTTDNFSVAYRFATGTHGNIAYRNLLSVTVSDDTGNGLGSGLFYGTIQIDDQNDIEFALDEEATFHIDCELVLEGDYTALKVKFDDTSETEIVGTPHLSKNDFHSNDRENDLFEFAANTVVIETDSGNIHTKPAKINLTGSVVFKDDHVTFIGSFDGKKTMDVVLSGRYRSVAGALQIIKEDDETRVFLNIAAQISFQKGSLEFGLSLGYSNTGSKTLKGEAEYTSDGGRTKVKGTLGVEHKDGLQVELALEGTIGLANGNSIEFRLAASTGEKTVVNLGGKVTLKDIGVFTFDFEYGGKKSSLVLELTDDEYSMFLKIVLDEGGNPTVGVGLTFYFGQHTQEPKVKLAQAT